MSSSEYLGVASLFLLAEFLLVSIALHPALPNWGWGVCIVSILGVGFGLVGLVGEAVHKYGE